MSKKTINQALKDLFLGLGGNPTALEDNSGVGDYIEDLESAIKGAGVSIDDTQASETTVYSSSKVESLIPTDELPTVTSEDNGNVLTVVEGAWAKAAPSGGDCVVIQATYNSGNDLIVFGDITQSQIYDLIKAGKLVVIMGKSGINEYTFLPSSDTGTVVFECATYGTNKVEVIKFSVSGTSYTSAVTSKTTYNFAS